MKRFQIEVSRTVTDHLTGQFVNGASIYTSNQKSNLYGDSLINPFFNTIFQESNIEPVTSVSPVLSVVRI